MADRAGGRLVEAVWDQKTDLVARLLGQGASANASNHAGSALWAAVSLRNAEIVGLLLAAGADANETSEGDSILHRAVLEDPQVSSTTAIVRALIENGAALDATDNEGATPLLAAVREAARRSETTPAGGAGEAPAIADLLAMLDIGESSELPEGLSLAPLDTEQTPPSPPAGRCSVIDLLLELGADPQAGDAAGSTATSIAQEEGDDELVEALTDRSLGAEGAESAKLLEAASKGEVDEVRALLAAGVDPNRQSARRGTPLSEAAMGGHLEAVRALLEGGADPNLRESVDREDDFTPLLSATYSGRLDVMQVLLDAGADPSLRGPGGRRLLDYAKLGEQEGHKTDRPWSDVLDLVRGVTSAQPALVRLTPVEDAPAVLAALEEAGLAVAWQRARIGSLEILESSPCETPDLDWDRLRSAARGHGYQALVVGWSLADVEPDLDETVAAFDAVDAAAGRRWLTDLVAKWRDTEELEEIRSSAIPDGISTIRPLLARGHVVLVEGLAELCVVAYGFAQPDLETQTVASILAAWREDLGGELAGLSRDQMSVVLPVAVSEPETIRARPAEIACIAPDLDDGSAALRLAASRQWSFWWD